MKDSVGDGTDDATLLEGWREGDRAAGNALVNRHFTAIYRFLRRGLADAAAAKDLTQRTFLTCLEMRDRIDASIRLRAYLLAIARNHLLRHVRDTHRLQARGCPDGGEESVVSPSRAVAQHELRDALSAVIRTLPDDLRTTLELHYWDDLTTTEIGVVLGVAAGTIKWRLSRARTMLRERIAELPASAAVRDSTLRRLDDWTRSKPDEPESG